MMNVAFRVDASVAIGSGHVMRCLTLADALSRSGATCWFMHREHDGHMAELITERGHKVVLLPPPGPTEAPDNADGYAQWLGIPPERDAEQTIAALDGCRLDWLVVDHYALDAGWEQRLRPHAERITVIDDLANRCHDADLLLDQNYSAEGAARYDGLLPVTATRLCGPAYALLHPAFAEHRKTWQPHTGRVERVFVFFGGTDPDNLTGRVLTALSTPEFAHWAIDAVVGANNPHHDALKAQAARRGQTTLHGPQSHLADLMAKADLAIGAGGATTWERCCLGLPSVVVSIAENQRPACEALAADGYIAYVGHHDQVTPEKLRAVLATLAGKPERLRHMALIGCDLVDGRGTTRMTDQLMAGGG